MAPALRTALLLLGTAAAAVGVTSSVVQTREYYPPTRGLRLWEVSPWFTPGRHSLRELPRPVDLDQLDTRLARRSLPLPQGFVDSQNDDDIIKEGSWKRSAVATLQRLGMRRERRPATSLGKAAPYVGMLNEMSTFFDSLRGAAAAGAGLPPARPARPARPAAPTAPAGIDKEEGGSVGGGVRKLYALRPLRPAGYIRSYNRRSFVEGNAQHPRANQYNPELLWTGLGR